MLLIVTFLFRFVVTFSVRLSFFYHFHIFFHVSLFAISQTQPDDPLPKIFHIAPQYP